MIHSFKSKAAESFYRGKSAAKINADHRERLLRILGVLDQSSGPEGMNLPGFKLHTLKGDLEGHHAVSVSGSWRVTFRFVDGHAVDVDYLDYH